MIFPRSLPCFKHTVTQPHSTNFMCNTRAPETHCSCKMTNVCFPEYGYSMKCYGSRSLRDRMRAHIALPSCLLVYLLKLSSNRKSVTSVEILFLCQFWRIRHLCTTNNMSTFWMFKFIFYFLVYKNLKRVACYRKISPKWSFL